MSMEGRTLWAPQVLADAFPRLVLLFTTFLSDYAGYVRPRVRRLPLFRLFLCSTRYVLIIECLLSHLLNHIVPQPLLERV